MKTKILALLEIAIVLCSVFLVATLPGIATDQKQELQEVTANEFTTAAEGDFTLEIYGNANEDDTIDMRDYTYTARIICWLEEETDLADANYDGRISVADMTQIGLIILGRECELTIVDSAHVDGDSNRRVVTIHKPVNRIVCIGYGSHGDYTLIRALNAAEKVVGAAHDLFEQKRLFPELQEGKVTDVGGYCPDYEIILALNPDLVTSCLESDIQMCEDAGIPAYRIGHTHIEDMAANVTKLGYILDRKEEAKEAIDFILDTREEISEKTEDIPEDEKPTVYIESGSLWAGDYQIASLYGPPGRACALAGGRNIFTDPSFDWCGPSIGAEWVIEQNPDIIIKMAYLGSPEYGYETDDPSGMEELRDEIMNRPELAGVNAVKNGQVYVISCNIVYPIYCSGVGPAYLAKMFHPDRFSDFDPKVVHQEYVDRFLSLDFDVYEHGVFVYPPLE